MVKLDGLLFEPSRALFVDAGVDPDDALAALVALTRGAVDNVGALGLPQALTGPAARGDVELVQQHLDALDGPTRALYVACLEATLPIARAKGLSEAAEAELRRLIDG